MNISNEGISKFDVFLCHNSNDKPAVRQIARRLRRLGIRTWFDEDDMLPGRLWQEQLERVIKNIPAAAVFVGPSNIGPWQDPEVRALLVEFVRRRCPVIPVLLPGAAPLELPLFLQGFGWVDLCGGGTAGIDRLAWGITGRKPRRFRVPRVS
jgi:hypothetical protein